MTGRSDQSTSSSRAQWRDAAMRGNRGFVWVGYVVVTLLLMDVVPLIWVGMIAPLAAATLLLAQRGSAPTGVVWWHWNTDRADLVTVATLYVAVVALFGVAFQGFGTSRVAGLFLAFAAGLLLGVLAPIYYMVWVRGRTLADMGIGAHRLGVTLALGMVFASVQFAMTLWGYDLPVSVDWVPLLVMSLVVGAFEAVFFRGFIQGRLERSFGTAPAVAVAAALYAAYHVAYGMGAEEMIFLFGLGLVYAVAYRLVENVLVLWPLLTPMGAFFNNLESGDIELPWASIAGFVDVAAVMAVAVWLAYRHQRRRTRTGTAPTNVAAAGSGASSGDREATGTRR